MKTLYEVLTTAKVDANAFKDLLVEYQVMDVFGNLYGLYSPQEAKKAILYILYVYTVNTPYVLANEALLKGKQRGCELAKLSEDMRAELVEFDFLYKGKATGRKLKGREEVEEITPEDAVEELVADNYRVDNIITVIDSYIKHQNDTTYGHLLMLKNIYDQTTLEAQRMLKRGNDVDFKAKMAVLDYAETLVGRIEEWEEKLTKKTASIKAQREEVKEVERKVFNSIRPETVV